MYREVLYTKHRHTPEAGSMFMHNAHMPMIMHLVAPYHLVHFCMSVCESETWHAQRRIANCLCLVLEEHTAVYYNFHKAVN